MQANLEDKRQENKIKQTNKQRLVSDLDTLTLLCMLLINI